MKCICCDECAASRYESAGGKLHAIDCCCSCSNCNCIDNRTFEDKLNELMIIEKLIDKNNYYN